MRFAAPLFSIATVLAACSGDFSSQESGLFSTSDMVSSTRLDDGNFFVVCRNGRTQTVSQQQLDGGDVCNDTPLAPVVSEIECPRRYKRAEINGGYYCYENNMVLGPFSEDMIHQCQEAEAGFNAGEQNNCRGNTNGDFYDPEYDLPKWPRDLYLRLRVNEDDPESPCAKGLSFDRLETGYCRQYDSRTTRDEAFGPFPEELIQRCIMGSAPGEESVKVCRSARWDAGFLKELIEEPVAEALNSGLGYAVPRKDSVLQVPIRVSPESGRAIRWITNGEETVKLISVKGMWVRVEVATPSGVKVGYVESQSLRFINKITPTAGWSAATRRPAGTEVWTAMTCRARQQTPEKQEFVFTNLPVPSNGIGLGLVQDHLDAYFSKPVQYQVIIGGYAAGSQKLNLDPIRSPSGMVTGFDGTWGDSRVEIRANLDSPTPGYLFAIDGEPVETECRSLLPASVQAPQPLPTAVPAPRVTPTPVPPPPPPPPPAGNLWPNETLASNLRWKVTEAALNCRERPGTTSDVLTVWSQGERVIADRLGASPVGKDTTGHPWLRVRHLGGSCWVKANKENITPAGQLESNIPDAQLRSNMSWIVADPEGLNCRTSAGVGNAIVTVIPTATTVNSMPGNALVRNDENGAPWVRLNQNGGCYVRASLKYIDYIH